MPINIDKFAKHLYAAADKHMNSRGKCGEYVRKALQAGGADFHGVYPPTEKAFGRALEMLGFHKIAVEDPERFNFIRGDVMVMQPHRGGNQSGHVAGYDGKFWISDFIQRDFWAGPDYRNQKPRPSYVVYRY